MEQNEREHYQDYRHSSIWQGLQSRYICYEFRVLLDGVRFYLVNVSLYLMKLTGPFLFILTTLMIDAVGTGLVFPIMPDLMNRVGADSAAEGALWGGILMSAYAAAMLLFGPIVGSLSDAYGRRPILIAALATLAIDYIIMALAQTYWILLTGRIIAGMAGATYITATAYISDITKHLGASHLAGISQHPFGLPRRFRYSICFLGCSFCQNL